jgi:hypothetical protein
LNGLNGIFISYRRDAAGPARLCSMPRSVGLQNATSPAANGHLSAIRREL